MRLTIFSLLVTLFISCVTDKSKSSKSEIWFDQPAKSWNEAIPIGNGALGGMVYGGIESDTIKINEETLWSGGPRNLQNYEAIKHLPEIRKLLFEDKTTEAQMLIDSTMLGPYNECYMPMGDLVITENDNGAVTDYKRQLDLNQSIVTVDYSIDGVKYHKEVFASFPDKAIVVKLSVGKPGKLNFSASLSSLLRNQVEVSGNQLILKGNTPKHAFPHYQGKNIRFMKRVMESDQLLKSDFLKLKFGMFIHYNMATYKNAQWVEGYPDPSEFNPGVETIDTDAWAETAVAAGMKYAVLTVKHVGGFCLWDSKYTTYDVMHPDCPYQKDLVAQFVKSFTDRGLKVGLYYCWRHPGFDANKQNKEFKVLPPECDPATHSLEEQIEFQKAQIAELLTKYPDVFYIWNDALDPEIMEAEAIIPFFKSIRPGILTSANWWDWSKKGTPYADIAVTEMRHFPENNGIVGETCWMLEDKWFWNGDTEPKSAATVIGLLKKVNSRNANLLFNVGPDKNGEILEPSVKILKEVGELIKK